MNKILILLRILFKNPPRGLVLVPPAARGDFFKEIKMQLAKLEDATKMTSKEVADLLETRHDSVKRTVERLILNDVIPQTPLVDGIKSANGVVERVYFLDKRSSIIVVAQISPQFTARLVDRWQELEAKQVMKVFKVPQTLSEALRLAADQQDTIVAQAAQLALAAPAVAFVDKFVEAKSSKCLSDVAKILGKKPQAFINQLSEDHVIFKRNGSWIPYQSQLDAGRFTVKTGESSGHAYEQTRVEPKGIEWLARVYGE